MSDYKMLSDSDLMVRLQVGNTYAYTEIYQRYHYLAIVYAYKKLRNEDLAKDIVQELFANLWEKRETIVSIDNIAAYLFTAVRNKVFDFIAHQNVTSKYIKSISEYTMAAGNANTDYLVREKQLKAYIDRAILELPSKMREVFELSRTSELTYKEIANKLSISERTVNNQISNALNRLKIKLGTYLGIVFLFF